MNQTTTVGRLSEEQLSLIFLRCNVTPVGQALTRAVRESPPIDAPAANREIGNTTGNYPCSLMGMALQIGSVIPDLALFTELDNRKRHPDLLEFWPRPTRIPNVVVLNENGTFYSRRVYKPRVLCIHESRIKFLDVVDDEVLLSSEVEGRNMYRQTPDGQWISPAINQALIPLGIGHEIWPKSKFGKYYPGNLSYLANVFRNDTSQPDVETVKKIVSRVESNGLVYRRELVADGIDADAIKWVIARELVFFPLAEEDLTNIEMCRLYVDRAAYLDEMDRRRAAGAGAPLSIYAALPRPGQQIDWHGVNWLVVNDGAEFTLRHCDGHFQDIPATEAQRLSECGAWKFTAQPTPSLANVSPKRRAEAEEKLALLSKPPGERIWASGPQKGQPVSESTFNRIKATVAKADANGTSRLAALASGYDNCGDHTPRVDGEMTIWRESLNEDYKKNHRPHYSSTYGFYLNRCKAANVIPVCETTARKRLAKEEKMEIVEEREGVFVAYERGMYSPREKSNRLVKGRIPWEVAHVDHARIEVEVRSCITGEIMKRPIWRTVLRDACTFRVLGLVVFFGAPSYVALYRLILDVARRFGKLPQYIISDRGLEFLARQWEFLLAECHVTKLNRPSRTPRAGQVAESGNRKDDLNIISNLPGNKLELADFRKLCQGFRPKDNAVLSLGSIRALLEEVYFETEPQHPTSRTKGEILLDYEARLLHEVGTSHIPKVPYSNNLRILCMPAPASHSGIRTVTPQGSVECNTLEYFSPILLRPGIRGSKVDVHYDPDNVGHVFVWVRELRTWVECRCDAYEILSQFTLAELVDYTAHLLAQGQPFKVDKRRNRAMAYAKVLAAARGSPVLIHMHEAARENAHGFPGFTVLGDGTIEVDLPRRPAASNETVKQADVEGEAARMAQF